jgi:hypothetical protein
LRDISFTRRSRCSGRMPTGEADALHVPVIDSAAVKNDYFLPRKHLDIDGGHSKEGKKENG